MVFGVDQSSLERHKQYPVDMGFPKDSGDTLDPNEFEAMADYSPVAGATGRTGFGVVVMPLRLRIYPIVLAKEVAAKDKCPDRDHRLLQP